MNKLIKINSLSSGDVPTVSGRELHKALKVETRYNDWFARMCEYGFIEGEDYYSFLSNRIDGRAGKPRTDHHLTIDTAKEICMIQRTEIGRTIRRYFIETEKKYRANPVINPNPMNSVQYNDYVSRENALALWEQQTKLESYVSTLEKRITELENQRTSLPVAETFYFTNDDDEYHIKEFLNSDKVQICPCGQVQASKLYALFYEWCNENNVSCCSIAMFGRRIKAIKGITKRKTNVGTKYTGLRNALE